MKKLLSIVLLAVCAGCATVVERETPVAVRMGEAWLETTALVEALCARKGTSVRAISGHWREHVFQAQCVLKGDGETLTVIFLAPQLRLVTITVTKPHAIRCERAPQVPRAFEPEFALVDLAFVNLETETLRRAVGGALRVEDDGTTRRIAMQDGAALAEIVRGAEGRLVYCNLVFGYAYELRDIR